MKCEDPTFVTGDECTKYGSKFSGDMNWCLINYESFKKKFNIN